MTVQQGIAYRRLYKNHGGSIGYWEGWVEGTADEAKVVLQYARLLDGKVTRREYQAERKNVGRSNETTCLEQAQLELDSRQSKQLDKGYTVSLAAAESPSTNTLGLTKPMLAQPLEKVKPDDIDWDTAYAQPKLDGHRALYKDGVLYSRQGKIIEMPHITEAIEAAGLSHLHLDGELYVHGKSLQEVSRLVKKLRPESQELTYHVYDVIGPGPWVQRINEAVERAYVRGDPGSPVQMLKCRRVDTFAALQAYHEHNLERGYEGTMLRWGNADYQDGKRSKHLLKMKNFQDAEFTIVGVQRGKPYVTDDGTYQVPVWVLDAGNGKTFTATAQGDMYEKHFLWTVRDQYIGQELTVKYHYLSADGIPQLPVALRFKETI